MQKCAKDGLWRQQADPDSSPSSAVCFLGDLGETSLLLQLFNRRTIGLLFLPQGCIFKTFGSATRS